MDAEEGVHVRGCKIPFDSCIFAGNHIGLSVGELTGGAGTNLSCVTPEELCRLRGDGIFRFTAGERSIFRE